MGNGRIVHVVKHVGLLAIATSVSACSGLSDFSMKDQQWFAGSSKMFSQNTYQAVPLTTTQAVGPEDLMSPDGSCSGMSAPVDANASADAGQAVVPAASGAVAVGQTECNVARGMGIAPDSVNFSTNERGERVAVATYKRGSRPGEYTFTAGRLSSMDRVDVPEPVKPARQAKPKKKPAAT